MNTSLALIQPSEFQMAMQLAKVAAQSGYAQKSEAEAVFLILKGLELGISPFAALDGIDVIKGKPTVSPQLMLGLINRSGLLENIEVTDDGNTCRVTMWRKGRSPHTESFGMDDAARMKTKEDGKIISLAEKHNWRAQPRNMRKWRAIGACARVVFPDVLKGLVAAEEVITDIEPVKMNPPTKNILADAPQNPTEHILTNAEARRPKREIRLSDGLNRAERLAAKEAETEPEIIEGEIVSEQPTPSPDELEVTAEGVAAELVELTGIFIEANKGKRFAFKTKGGRTVSCWGSSKLSEAGYAPDWFSTGDKFDPAIQCTVVEKVTAKGTFYNVLEVMENPNRTVDDLPAASGQ